MNLNSIIQNVNIAEDLSEEKLTEISITVKDGYTADKQSRDSWEKATEQWMKLALQVVEKKTYPWVGASNIKYPLVATAGMQFAARAYPTLVPADGRVVKCKNKGPDQGSMHYQQGLAIEKHMSYQIMDEMEEWEDEQDKLLTILPIVGIAFKKTYFDHILGRNYSCLVHPSNLVINYWATSLEEVHRVSEIMYMDKRVLKENQLAGIFRKVELDAPLIQPRAEINQTRQQEPPSKEDDSTPYTIIEQHTFLDLDGDEYPEPYIVTFDLESGTILRIVARFLEDGIKTDDKGTVVKIVPISFYTKFGCIPNPDGSFYDIGFGHLLGPLNDSVNTLINQLVDSGSLNNLQSGFVGKGLKIRMSEQRFQPGEWKSVANTADDLRKNIFPLPTKEPSAVLFNLLGMLVQSGKELASVADIMVGKNPGQNTPAYTTQETVRQGMMIFTAIYKRVYRSMAKEFKKLRDLNAIYLDDEATQQLGFQLTKEVYQQSKNTVIPAADPEAATMQDKQEKAGLLIQMLQFGTLDPMKATMEFLESAGFDNPQQYLIQQQPPNPKEQEMQAKMQMESMKAQNDAAKAQHSMKMEEMKAALRQQESVFGMKLEAQRQQFEMEMEKMKSDLQAGLSIREHKMKMLHEQQKRELRVKSPKGDK